MIRWLAAALAALLLTATPVSAQTVNQSGTVSPGHAGCWVTSGLLKDGGSPSNFQCNGLGLYNGTNSPLGISSQTGAGPASGTWGTLTLGSTSSAASLTTLNSAGTAQPLNINVGGDATYVIGGTNWLSTIFGQQFCTTTGSVLYRDSGGTWKCLAPGTSGQVLQTQGPNLNPQWAGSGGIGTVTSITAGTGLSGGAITTSGTIALLNPVAVNLGGTGAATLAAHGVLLGNGTTAVNVATPGVAGTVLQSNGAGADPTWNAVAGTGTVTSITAADGTVTVSPSPLTTSGTIKVATNGVANANLAQMTADTIKANVTGSTANATDATPGALSAILCQPVINVYTTGSSTTYTTPTCNSVTANLLQIEMVGGGGGGGGANTTGNSPTSGSVGGNTLWQTSSGVTLFSAVGGSGGAAGNSSVSGGGGAGGTGGTGSADVRIAGQKGGGGVGATGISLGGLGGGTPFAGSTPSAATGGNGITGPANSGTGGSGEAGDGSTYNAGGGGGAPEYVRFHIATPAASYEYTVGAAGVQGSGVHNGGNGDAGLIIVKATWQ